MLARLRAIPGIESIDVDHSATHMRVRIASADPEPILQVVLALLRMEGYGGRSLDGDDADRATARIDAWLGTNAASELSREEARALADDAVARFAAGRPLAAAASERLKRTVSEHLYRSFTAPDAAAQLGALFDRALPAIVAEARTYLGPEDASALDSTLRAFRPV